MIAVRHADKRERRLQQRYAKAVEAHERIEADLARTMNRWQKSRIALRRMERTLDKEFAVRSAADVDALSGATHDLTPRAVQDMDFDDEF